MKVSETEHSLIIVQNTKPKQESLHFFKCFLENLIIFKLLLHKKKEKKKNSSHKIAKFLRKNETKSCCSKYKI